MGEERRNAKQQTEQEYRFKQESALDHTTKEERKRIIETERKLAVQDAVMWEKNEGISQLEGRIATKSFQG